MQYSRNRIDLHDCLQTSWSSLNLKNLETAKSAKQKLSRTMPKTEGKIAYRSVNWKDRKQHSYFLAWCSKRDIRRGLAEWTWPWNISWLIGLVFHLKYTIFVYLLWKDKALWMLEYLIKTRRILSHSHVETSAQSF